MENNPFLFSLRNNQKTVIWNLANVLRNNLHISNIINENSFSDYSNPLSGFSMICTYSICIFFRVTDVCITKVHSENSIPYQTVFVIVQKRTFTAIYRWKNNARFIKNVCPRKQRKIRILKCFNVEIRAGGQFSKLIRE